MKTAIGVLGLGIALFCTTQATAQQLQGQPAVHAWTVPGVVQGGADTYFMCTNTLTTPVRVGIELVDATGTVINDASASSREVPAGGTVMFGTFAGFLAHPVDSELCGITGCAGGPLRGLARILTTASLKASSQVLCVAIVVSEEARRSAPAFAYNLPVIRPEK
jgi:hypothetical protein